MANDSNCCTFFRGSIYLSKYVDPCSGFYDLSCNEGLVYNDLGNVQQATVTINSSVLGVDSHLNSTVDLHKTRLLINSVDLNLNVTCSKDQNLIKFLGLDKSLLNLGNETKRFSCSIDCCSVLFLKKNPSNVVVTLKDEDGADVRVLDLNIDYELGIDFVKFLKDLTDDYSYLEISYDYDESSLYDLSALKNFNTVYSVMFKGVNYAEDGNEQVDVELYKVRFSFLSSLDLISDGNFLNLSLQGRVEKDLSRECKGQDAYFKIKKSIGSC